MVETKILNIMNVDNNSSVPITIDVNNPKFYDEFQEEIESDMARLKKSVTIVKRLRLTAAEVEVETAALYHAELCHQIEELKTLTGKIGVLKLNEYSNNGDASHCS